MGAVTGALRIVPMEAGHIPALAEIERLCFSTPWLPRMLEEELHNPAAVFRVALAGQTPVGYAGMTSVCGEGYLDNVAVHPACRRRGVASALLGCLDRYARAHGFSLLTLEVRVSNAAAIRVYERAGFARRGVRPGFYDRPREDAAIMTKFYGPAPCGPAHKENSD